MNDKDRTLLRYVVEGDIRKAQQQAKIILESITTAKDEQFKTRCLSQLSAKAPELIELPYNMQGLLVAEDVSNFPENRYLLRDSEKTVIERLLKTRKASLRLKELGIHYTCSLLLQGEPGTGKTELARYIAYKAELPFVYLKFSGLISSALGKTQQNIGQVFDYARRSPCVLCLDEIDAIGMSRGGKDDVILIGTTNRSDQLDAALFRRFSFLHRVRSLDKNDAATLAKMFFASTGYPTTEHTVCDVLETIESFYTASNVTKACTDYLVNQIVNEEQEENHA